LTIPTLIRDLKITEVSSVDRGAGVGVRVVLMKRDTQKEAGVQTVTIEKMATVDSDELDRRGVVIHLDVEM
jgi:hypothetical protein